MEFPPSRELSAQQNCLPFRKVHDMDKLSFNRKDFLALLTICLLGIIFVTICIGIIGNHPQEYKEYIVETVAFSNSNKSGEIHLFWALLFGGCLLSYILQRFLQRSKQIHTDDKSADINTKQSCLVIVLLLLNLAVYFMSGAFAPILLCASSVYVLLSLILPDRAKDGLILFVFLFYSITSFTFLLGLVKALSFNTDFLLLAAVLVEAFLFVFVRNKDGLRKISLLLQIALPFLLVSFIGNRYIYNNSVISMELAPQVYIVIFSLLAVLLFFSVRHAMKSWNPSMANPHTEVVSISACLAIAIFSTYSSTQLFVPNDVHHVGEAILSFQQVFELKQIPYVNYFPVSGLFSVVLGGILKFLGGGITYFAFAQAFLRIFFAVVIMLLCSKQLNKSYCLLISSVFVLAPSPVIARAYLILPSVLILLLPQLIKRKQLWLMIWIWLCLIGVLYYPLYGVATFLGSLPFAIVQLYSFVKSGEFRVGLKTVRFYLLWLIVLLPVILCLPLLFGIAKHTLVYSSQSVLADGIAVFGQDIPGNFMPALSAISIVRRACYYAIRFLLPAVYVWIFLYVLIKSLKQDGIRLSTFQSPLFLVTSFGILSLLVSYTYTIVREDVGVLTSRSAFVLIPLASILIILICVKYLKDSFYNKLIIGFVVLVAVLLGNSFNSVQEIDNRLVYEYDVHADYHLITPSEQDTLKNIGPGFVNSYQMETGYLSYMSRMTDLLQYDSNLSFCGLDFSYIYVTGARTCTQPSFPAIKSDSTTSECISVLRAEKPVIFNGFFSSISQYHLYEWLMLTNEYVYSKQYDAFLPVSLSNLIGGGVTSDKRLAPYAVSDVGLAANSLGRSIDTLIPSFELTDVKLSNIDSAQNAATDVAASDDSNVITYNYSLSKSLNGSDGDFLYVDLAIDADGKDKSELLSSIGNSLKKNTENKNVFVTVLWDNDYAPTAQNSMQCQLGTGALLIPLGSNNNWLLNSHSKLSISVVGLPVGQIVSIQKMILLKSIIPNVWFEDSIIK